MVEAPNGLRPALLVFADDWGRHPSSAQHLVRRLLDRYTVCWVNTIGTRPPRLDAASFRRGLEKLRHWTRPANPPAPLPANLRVLNPWMWPWFRSSFCRALNRELLLRQLLPVVRAEPVLPVAVTTLPLVADVVGSLPVRRWVYYCVDDFGAWPGLDQAPLRRLEARLIQRADTFIAVSTTLQEKLASAGKEAQLLTHGVDLDHWENPAPLVLPELAQLERPWIVFWGVTDRRLDIHAVRRLSEDLRRGTIVLVGPEADPDPELFAAKRMTRLGPVAWEQLPAIAQEAAVLVMPYADLPATRAMQPLKLKEYLATGRPVVVMDLPANRCWADCLDMTDTPEAFSQAVRLRIDTGLPMEQRAARARLAGESWSEKARLFERWALADPVPALACCP
jgi:glycosyltransferase involved in cell wall biosynthesis